MSPPIEEAGQQPGSFDVALNSPLRPPHRGETAGEGAKNCLIGL